MPLRRTHLPISLSHLDKIKIVRKLLCFALWCLTNCLAAQHQPLVLPTVEQLESKVCRDVHCRGHLVVPGGVVKELTIGGVIPNLGIGIG